MLYSYINKLHFSVEDLASLSISADSVSAALNKLKHGKSEGGSLSSDH